LQDVETNATAPRSIFAKEFALRKAATEDEAYGAANITADKQMQFQICLSNAVTEAATWSMAVMERVTNQLGREIDSIP
jgi:hypothetical protein